MTTAYEIHGGREAAGGMRGWRVALSSAGDPDRIYGFDERDGVETAAEAVQRAFTAERDGDRARHGAEILVSVREIRVLLSAEISPN